jgi:hypothetical protein
MAQRGPALFALTPKSISGLATVFLVLAALFGFLNSQKLKTLHASFASAQANSKASPTHSQAPAKSDAQIAGAKQHGKAAEGEDRIAKAEAALAQAEKEKTDLQAKLDASQQEIAALRERPIQATDSPPAVTVTPAENTQSADLQSQVDELRHQLDSAEKEKALLAEKIEDAQQHTTQAKEPIKETKKKRDTAPTQRESINSHRPGVHGTVLAYNQAYNFVVLNLGARNGVEPNSEMLVLRDGTLIGKIRISSVEPATAIGDIITNSLARGVQVQPGDNVIYAGTSP